MTTFPISEGFDNYTNTTAMFTRSGDLTWWSDVGPPPSFGAGAYGGQAAFAGYEPPYAVLSSVSDPIYFGGRINLSGVITGGRDFLWLIVGSLAIPHFTAAWTLVLNPTNGVFQVLDDLFNLQWTSENSLFPKNSWFYLEFEANSGSGTLVIRVNGIVAATATGVVLGSQPVFAFRTQSFGVSEYLIDDLYWSTSGFLGENRSVIGYPTANSSVQWTSDSGSANYVNVSSISPTSANSSGTAGQTDLFAVGTLPSGPINAAAVKLSSYTNNVPDSGMEILLSSSGTIASSGTIVNGTGAAISTLQANVDPATSAAWTTASLNAALAGYTEVS